MGESQLLDERLFGSELLGLCRPLDPQYGQPIADRTGLERQTECRPVWPTVVRLRRAMLTMAVMVATRAI